jgi:plastocyanin
MLLFGIVATMAIVGMPGTASAGGGCHTGATENDASGEQEATVRLVDACFSASVTTVDPGTPVTFVDMDAGIVHNVSGSQWGHFEEMTEGDAFTVSFDEAGIYPFACQYHPGMTGAIVVGDGTGAGNGAGITVEPFEAPAAPQTVTRVVTQSGGVSAGSLAVAAIVGGLLGAAITVGLSRSRKVPARVAEPI